MTLRREKDSFQNDLGGEYIARIFAIYLFLPLVFLTPILYLVVVLYKNNNQIITSFYSKRQVSSSKYSQNQSSQP